MSNQKNICCRVFKEQFELIRQLPESERGYVLYQALNNAFNQFENQNDNQIENQNEKKQTFDELIGKIGKENTNSILIDSNFSCSKFDVFKVYIQNVPAEIIKSVESWIKKEKNGQTVPVEFITKQFINFANRQNKPLFKGEQQCK